MTFESLSLFLEIAIVAVGLLTAYFWAQWLLALYAARNEQARYVGHRKFELPLTAIPDPNLFFGQAKEHAQRARRSFLLMFIWGFAGGLLVAIVKLVPM
jgi:hypothetical protein